MYAERKSFVFDLDGTDRYIGILGFSVKDIKRDGTSQINTDECRSFAGTKERYLMKWS